MPKAMKRKIFTKTGGSHFVTFSAYHRRNLLQTPRAKQIVISQLGMLAGQGRVKVSGFVIMPDHAHAVLWFDNEADLPKVIQVWKSTSAHYLRKLYEEEIPDMIDHLKTRRNGRELVCFWQRRYYDFNITTMKKLSEKLEYMHWNPVKKGLCKRPWDYNWSSAPWYFKKRGVGVKINPGF
jgi:putative transposase